MAEHNDLGRMGEQLAEAWLVKHGFAILEKNFCYGKAEIDIIALKNSRPHFVEVKCRSSNRHGHPEGSVSIKKTRNLLKAVEHYLFKHRQYTHFQIDILSITLHTPKGTAYFFIEDIYL